MEELIIKTTKAKELIDITDHVSTIIHKHHVRSGLCHLFLKHTTAALTTSLFDQEYELDLLGAFEMVIPCNPLKTESHPVFHTHHHTHISSHIISSLLGPSLVIPVKEGVLQLGTLQRIVLVELNGPRDRNLLVDTGKME
jgi:secondary thiamine-phosphate synthase enzyme